MNFEVRASLKSLNCVIRNETTPIQTNKIESITLVEILVRILLKILKDPNRILTQDPVGS